MRITKLYKPTLLVLGLASLGLFLLGSKPALASNPATINFQGKVVNADGTNVTGGTYSFVFRIYDSANPSIGSSCSTDSHCKWEETQSSVTVTNGVFQVELGSACALTSGSCNNSSGGPINWSTTTSLYLTLKFGSDTSGTCNSVSSNGFMCPAMHITSVPFALQADNSTSLDGLSAGNFVQLAQSLQADSTTTNGSIAINKTGASGDILLLEANSKTALQVDNSGSLILGQAGTSGLAGVLTFHNPIGSGTASITLAADPSTNYTYQLPTGTVSSNQCLQSGTVSSGNVPLLFSSCSAGGDNIFVNTVAATDADFTDVASSTTVTGTTWTNNGGSPNQLVINVGNADATHAGAVTATGSQAFGGNKTFNGTVAIQNTGASAFQVQTNSGTSTLLNADTNNMRIGVDNTYTALGTPTGLNVAAASSGSGNLAGTVGTTQYYYEVTAIDSAGGETQASTESTPVTLTATKIMNLYWTAVTGASGYKIYRSTSSSGEVYLTTVQSNYSSGSPYQDTGSITAGSATPPGSTNAYTSANSSGSSLLQLSVGGLGKPTGQLYVSGAVPKDITTGGLGIGVASRTTSVYVSGRYAYVVESDASKLQVFSVSNPAAPADVSSGGVSTCSGPQSVYIQSHYAYVVCNIGKLQVFDISNPAVPADLTAGGVSTNSCDKNVYVQGRYAYLSCSTSKKLQIFDVSNPASPTALNTGTSTTNTINYVYVQGRYAYMGESTVLQIFDVSNPNSVTDPSTGGLATNSISALYVQGRYAYAVESSANIFQVFDISNPAAPVDVSSGGVSTGASSHPDTIFVQGRYAYIGNNASNKLQVFDISNPAYPVDVSAGGVSANAPISVYVSGRYAYVGGGSISAGTLQVFDLGGAYVQQLEAGGLETGTISVDSSLQAAGDASIQGGLNVGAGLQIAGDVGIQPAQNLTSGHTNITQTLTNASGTGGTVQGFSQTITISNTSSAGTTNGINIALSDATTLGNTTNGINVNLTNTGAATKTQTGINSTVTDNASSSASTNVAVKAVAAGSNGNQLQYALDAQANHGIAVRGASTGSGNINTTCGPWLGSYSIGVCGTTSASSNGYGGFFAATSNSDTALMATNGSSTAKILDLFNNTTSVFTVGSGGLITLQPSASLTSGQTNVAQTLTNASSTGGTVNGYSQAITVSNTSSASTTNGINIAITDATTLANTTTGVNATITDNGASGAKTNKAVAATAGGSNTSAVNYGGYFTLSGGAASSAALYASNGSVSANILQLQDNTTNVLQVANEGAVTLQNTTDSTAAFQILNKNGNDNLLLASTTNSNLITNSSGETNATGWAINTSTGSITSDTSQALYGNASLNITTTGGTANQGAKFSNVLTASQWYAFSFWARTASSTFTVQAGRSDNNTFAGETTCTLNATAVSASWQRYTCTFQAGGSITSGGYVFIRASDSVNRTWYIDGIQLEQSTSNTAPSAYHEGSIQLNGTITSPTTFQNQSDTSVAFQIQDAAGAPLFLVDTTSTDNAGATVNYLKYSGFESGSFGDATAGWNKVASATLSQNSNKKHSFNGLYSAQLVTTASGDGMTTSSFTSSPPTGTYVVSFYAKTSSGTFAGNSFQVTATPGTGGANICSPTSSLTINSSGFQRLYCSVTTNGTMTALQITQNVAGANTFYIDSVQLQSTTYNGNSINVPTAYQLGELQLRGVITNPLIVSTNGDSVSAFQVQNTAGSSLITADTLNGQVLLGANSALAGKLVFNSSSTGSVSIVAGSTSSTLVLTLPTAAAGSNNQCIVSSTGGTLSFLPCGAGSQSTVTLTPEFVGAVLTPLASGSHTGTMTSDFCGNDGAGSFADINTGICNTSGDFHNYYNWTSTSAGTNDYDIFVRWSVPSDFSSFSTVQFNSKKSSTSDDVKMTIYTNAGATCGTATSMTNTASAWQTTTYTISGCSPSAGNVIIFDIHMAVAASSDTVQMGEIPITYNRN